MTAMGKTCEEKIDTKYEKFVDEICQGDDDCIDYLDAWKERKLLQCTCVQPAQEAFKLERIICKAKETKAEKRTCMKAAKETKKAAIAACKENDGDDGNDEETIGLAQIMMKGKGGKGKGGKGKGKTCDERLEKRYTKLVDDICEGDEDCIVYIDAWKERKLEQCTCKQDAKDEFKAVKEDCKAEETREERKSCMADARVAKRAAIAECKENDDNDDAE